MSEDPEREPVPAADPARVAPGVGSNEEDPVAMAMIEPTTPEQTPAQEPPAEQAPAEQTPRATNAGRVWIALAVATVLLALLIIFIAENSRSVTISFLGASGHISLALALLVAAVVGAAVTLLAGTARILQLRLEVRRHKRASRRHRQGAQPR
jgi:lipopolysaccharide assembly protein A